ncbi:hypothetical protein Tco_0565424 [Tanacetum coccineum]
MRSNTLLLYRSSSVQIIGALLYKGKKETPQERLKRITRLQLNKQGSIPINRGLIQDIPTSLPPQPIGEATNASNLQRIPPGVQGRSHFTYFLYLIDNLGFTILYYPRSGSLPVSAWLGTMAGVDVDTLTMEQYLALSKENQAPGVGPILDKTSKLLQQFRPWLENVFILKNDTTKQQAGISEAVVVGCQICEGPHLDKDCPLNEEVKQVKEVRYGEFGRTTPFNGNNRGKFHVGPPGYYTKTDNRPPYCERRQSLEELLAKHQEESTRRSTKMEEKWDQGLEMIMEELEEVLRNDGEDSDNET